MVNEVRDPASTVLVTVLVEAEVFAPKVLIADLTTRNWRRHMVRKWIKDNVIGDFAEERRRREAEQAATAECQTGHHEGEGPFCTRCGQRIGPPVASSEAVALAKPKTRAFSTRDFALPIVGESNYQGALRHAKDGVKDYAGTAYIKAILAREPDNRFDPGAVKVMTVELHTIGYLSRDDAARYGAALELWEGRGYLVHCQAKVIGGSRRKENIGAWLDLAEPGELAATFHAARNSP